MYPADLKYTNDHEWIRISGDTAEIGHLAVRTGVRCACGRDGCLEAIASAARWKVRWSSG